MLGFVGAYGSGVAGSRVLERGVGALVFRACVCCAPGARRQSPLLGISQLSRSRGAPSNSLIEEILNSKPETLDRKQP